MFTSDKIPGELGLLILNEDGAVVSSAGELENNEHVAGVIYNMLSLSDKLDNEPYHSLSVIYDEGYGYVVTISNKKIYIVKRSFPLKGIPQTLTSSATVDNSSHDSF